MHNNLCTSGTHQSRFNQTLQNSGNEDTLYCTVEPLERNRFLKSIICTGSKTVGFMDFMAQGFSSRQLCNWHGVNLSSNHWWECAIHFQTWESYRSLWTSVWSSPLESILCKEDCKIQMLDIKRNYINHCYHETANEESQAIEIQRKLISPQGLFAGWKRAKRDASAAFGRVEGRQWNARLMSMDYVMRWNSFKGWIRQPALSHLNCGLKSSIALLPWTNLLVLTQNGAKWKRKYCLLMKVQGLQLSSRYCAIMQKSSSTLEKQEKRHDSKYRKQNILWTNLETFLA